MEVGQHFLKLYLKHALSIISKDICSSVKMRFSKIFQNKYRYKEIHGKV